MSNSFKCRGCPLHSCDQVVHFIQVSRLSTSVLFEPSVFLTMDFFLTHNFIYHGVEKECEEEGEEEEEEESTTEFLSKKRKEECFSANQRAFH